MPGPTRVGHSLPEGTLKAGVLYPLIWPQLAALPLKTEGHGQGWNSVAAAAALGPRWRQKMQPQFSKNVFFASSLPALNPCLLPSFSVPLAASLPPAGPG